MILGFWNWEMLELGNVEIDNLGIAICQHRFAEITLCIAYFYCCFQIASKHLHAQIAADFFAMTNHNFSIGFFPILH
jgi:hypothetical protein